MEKITSQLACLVLITAFFILSPSDNVYALGDQDGNFIRERMDPFSQSKNFRGRRKGFITGFGVGVGRTRFTQTLAEYYWGGPSEGHWQTPHQTRSALTTELKIGHGLSDQFLFYYTSRITWLPLQHFYRDTMIANGTAGMGLMYFPFRRVDIYLVGSIGLATLVTWHPPFKLERARQTGVAASAGIGYELFSHWNIDFTVNFGNASRVSVDDLREIALTDEIVTFSVTLNALAY